MKFDNRILVPFIILLTGYICYLELGNKNQPMTFHENKVWVYLELKSILVRDTSDFFYFGQINESIFDRIDRDPKTEGILRLSNIRYWNDADKLQIYENGNNSDFKFHRIEDIHVLRALKMDPVFIYDEDELDESALMVRHGSK